MNWQDAVKRSRTGWAERFDLSPSGYIDGGRFCISSDGMVFKWGALTLVQANPQEEQKQKIKTDWKPEAE